MYTFEKQARGLLPLVMVVQIKTDDQTEAATRKAGHALLPGLTKGEDHEAYSSA